MRRLKISAKAARFTESVIREMTRLCHSHNAVNLAQGFPDFPAPEALKAAAKAAIDAEKNQYAITWGAKSFRDALAKKTRRCTGLDFDPEREITVCCGSTEAMIAALLATVDPGEEIVIFEPFYENYGPDAILTGATPIYVKLRPPPPLSPGGRGAGGEGEAGDWTFDPAELRAAFSPRTKGIIVNTPHNPTGKVFTREELTLIGDLAREFDALIYTDEIYEHILYDGLEHAHPFTLPGLRERTVAISGLSKTCSVTGWRIGYVLAPPEITAAVRKVHDFLTVGAPAPLQEGAATALAFEDSYYAKLREDYQKRRDLCVRLLCEAGFRCHVPRGAYYVMTEYPQVSIGGGPTINDDVEFARYLVQKIGVASVPGSSFYRAGASEAKKIVRFCFSKTDATLREAGRRLRALRG